MRHFLIPTDPEDENGQDYFKTDRVFVNGYAVGDRLLEDVIFEITLDANGTFKATITPDCAAYFADLNEAKWLAAIERYCAKVDLFSATNPENEVEAVCWDDSRSLDKQAWHATSIPRIVGPWTQPN
jgi:hypothetical protein